MLSFSIRWLGFAPDWQTFCFCVNGIFERHAGSIEEFARAFARTGGQRGSAFAIRNQEKSQAHNHGSTSSSAPTAHKAFLVQLGDRGRTFDLLDLRFAVLQFGRKERYVHTCGFRQKNQNHVSPHFWT